MPSSTRPIDRALEITFDPSTSGMAAADVQGAIDELWTAVDTIPSTPGPTGEQGPAGADGATGPQGPQGPQGPSGVTSATAPIVYSGNTVSIDESGFVHKTGDETIAGAKTFTGDRIGFLGATAIPRPSGDIGAALVALGLLTNPTGAVTPYRFGASGTITTGAKPPLHRVRSAGTATRLDMTLAAGTGSATIEVSTDDGATWPTSIGPVSVASGKSATAAVSTSIPADALLRVNYTAATAASDPLVTLYLREG
jgi:hypothetical protein